MWRPGTVTAPRAPHLDERGAHLARENDGLVGDLADRGGVEHAVPERALAGFDVRGEESRGDGVPLFGALRGSALGFASGVLASLARHRVRRAKRGVRRGTMGENDGVARRSGVQVSVNASWRERPYYDQSSPSIVAE